MTRGHLDRKLLNKIADKLGKERSAINVRVSRKASKLGISSGAALILLAKELGIGTAYYQRKLDSAQQAEVRDSLPTVFARPIKRRTATDTKKQIKTGGSKKVMLKAAIEYLLQDQELLSRCGDTLLAHSNFDRPINQATLILEDRIRRKAEPSKRLVGDNLVGYAFRPELSQTVLRISKNADEQRGFTSILKGVVPAFRNPTHHHITNTFTQQEALQVCSFIDVLLRVVNKSVKIK
ncbi:MAG: TIGR02391 family protein [Planctomycetota bacterium]|jgi:uncharacterized protein (TIGR02391 family)